MVLLNKVDLVSQEQILKVRETLGSQRPDLQIYETTFGQIQREWFEKNRYEASEMGKAHTALVINFGPDEPYNENHYIIDEYLFKTLLEYLEQENS